jgi:haloacetate dehalogenase
MLREQLPGRPSNTRCARTTGPVSGVDRDADDSDRAAGHQIANPLLVLWGDKDNIAELYGHDVLGVWRPWAHAVTGHALDTGHHMMEDAPHLLTSVPHRLP